MLRNTPAKLMVVLVALGVTGVAKLPVERDLASDLQERRLLPLPLNLSTREQLGQTSFAIVLGGLRSLVAAMLNLSAHNHWAAQEWFELEQDYRTITTLQPRVRYYWESAGWHLAYNAYADYRDKPGIPEARRRTLQREFLRKGIAFLKQGTANLPDDWRMWEALAILYRDPHKNPALPAALEAYERALECPGVPDRIRRFHLYTLLSIPGKAEEEDTWKVARALWADETIRKPTTLLNLYFVLQNIHAPEAEHLTIEEIYGDRATALDHLSWHWNRRGEGLPMHGVRKTIEGLSRDFNIPPEHNPLLAEPGRWSGYPTGLLRPTF